MASLAIAALATFGFISCGGSGSDGGSADQTADSGGQNGAVEAPTIADGEKVPEGLEDATDQTLIAVIQADPAYQDYTALLQVSGAAKDLAIGDRLTVFAPVNEAVQVQSRLIDRFLAPDDLKSVLADVRRGVLPEIDDPEGLSDFLKRGIANGELAPDQVETGHKLRSLT